MQPDDIARIRTPSDPRVHPDGSRVAFTVSRPDLDHDRYQRSIWIWEAGEARPFTAGPGDSGARWSPDGTRLAFLRAGEGRQAQVAVIPAGGGEATVIGSFDLGVESVEWSPDGSRLLALAVTWGGDLADLDAKERSRRPRRISRFPYRFDNRGWLHDRRRRLWLIDPAGGDEPRCLTPDDDDVSMPAWSPDGARVAYLADRHPMGGIEPGMDVVEIDLDSGETVTAADRRYWSMPVYRPDGVLHLLGVDEHGWPGVVRLYRREADGRLTDLSGHLDRSLVSVAVGPPRIEWQGMAAVSVLEDSGRSELVRIRPDGTVDRLVGGDRVVGGFDVAGEVVVFVASTPTDPGEVMRLDGDGERALTTLNDGAVDAIVSAPEHFRIPTEGVEIDAWVLLPSGSEPVPVLVNVHGGPASQYGFGFFDEFQVYAAAGFGVVACNPRGSAGRGEPFLRAVVGEGWGAVDLADVMAVLDAALDRFPRLDPDRIGIMGGSYGGFLTAWATASVGRFRSAVVERALLSFPSFAGTSDIGPTFPSHYTGVDYPDGWGVWWEKSPLAIAHRITTPTLVLHAEQDWRCPVEQAEQLFVALLRNGVETEMLRFPDEGHEMSRSGSPRHRVDRFEAILDWHRRFLGAGPATPPGGTRAAPGG